MAAAKISQLTSYTTPLAADLVPIVDNATTTTKKITYANLTAPLLRIDGSNIMDNNVALQQKDSGGTARDIFKTSSANLLTLGNATDTMRLKAGNAATLGHLLSNVADDTIALIAAAQVLTNKTITAAVLSGSFTGTYNLAGTPTITSPTIVTPILSGSGYGGTLRSDISAPQGFLVNGKISVTVASNNITVAIKTLAGADPSATDPVYIRIADTVRAITAATSVTKAAGTNWMNAGSNEFAGKEVDYFIYLLWSAIDAKVGVAFARVPTFCIGSDTNGTTTGEKALMYDTTGIPNLAAADNLEVIGRFAATNSGAASYNWSVPSFTTVNLIQRPIYNTRYLLYTPQGPTNNSGSGRYMIHMNTVFCTIRLQANGAMDWTLMPTLPISSSTSFLSALTDYDAVGVGGYIDAGTANKTMGIVPHLGSDTPTRVRFEIAATSAGVTATTPMTWANTDVAWVKFDYEH